MKYSIWGGYGFVDTKWKYGAAMDFLLYKPKNISLNITGSYDGESNLEVYRPFALKPGFLNPSGFRHFYIERADYTKKLSIEMHAKPINYMQIESGITFKAKTPSYNYYFKAPDVEGIDFNYSLLNFGFRFAPKEELYKTPYFKISRGSNYPIMYFNYSTALKMLGGDIYYNRIDFRVYQSFQYTYLGRSAITFDIGRIFGDVPYSELYDGGGSYSNWSLTAPQSFITMRSNEFTNDRYVCLYFEHNFRQYFYKPRMPFFAPEPVFITNIGWGKLANAQYHKGITMQDMRKGYFESGLLINNIIVIAGLEGAGIGLVYRYGAYHLPNFWDNFAIKFSLTLKL